MNATNNAPKPIHIFKPGRHVSMAGDVIEFSDADVAAMARVYDPKLHEAPLVIGHPKTDSPAQGWVSSLAANISGLFAIPRDVEVAFAEQVGERRWGKVSSKFYSPDSPSNPVPGSWYLRHVGFLGAQPPGVKGLENPSFADAGDGCVEFQEAVEFGDWEDRNVAGMFRSLRDWLLAKFGKEDADAALPGWSVDSAQEAAAQPEAESAASQAAFSDAVIDSKETVVPPEQKSQLEAENARLKQRLAQLEAQEKAALASKRNQENAAFAEGLVTKGVLLPKHKGAVVALLDLAATPGADGKSVEFGDGDGKQPLVSAVKGFLGELPPCVEFGEVATNASAAAPGEKNPLLADAEARSQTK